MMNILKVSRCGKLGSLLAAIIICVFALPSLSFAERPIRTFDRESIRYPSMDTGQVWARIGNASSSHLYQESHTGENGIAQDLGIKRFKTMPPKTSRLKRKTESQIAARQADKQEIQKTSPGKTVRLKNVNLTEGMTSEVPKPNAGGENRRDEQETNAQEVSKPSQTERNGNYRQALSDSETPKLYQTGIHWDYKRVLYDVDCSLKMSRVLVTYYFDKSDKLLKLKQTPEAKWYHIYPRSFEEQLYTEICHPR